MQNNKKSFIFCWETRNSNKDKRIKEICLDFGLYQKQKKVFTGRITFKNLRDFEERILCVLENKTDKFDIVQISTVDDIINIRQENTVVAL